MTNKGALRLAAFPNGGLALIVIMLIFGAIGLNNSNASTFAPTPSPVPQQKHALVPSRAQASANPAASQPVYRHSVIPGGVRASSELASALARDRVARIHYANFDAAKARLVHLKAPRLVHVSYRMGNKIYWTKKKVRLAKGETLLTDGKSFVRTRCGNRIADVAQSTVSDREPAPEVLDTVIPEARGSLNHSAHSTSSGRPLTAPFAASFISAPTGALQMPQLLSARTPSSATIAPAPVTQGSAGALPAPIPVTGNVNAGSPVASSQPPAEITPEKLPLPPAGVPSPTWSPTPSSPTTQSPIPNPNGGEPILGAFPPPSTAFPTPPIITPPDNAATKVPEPGSFALVLLALFTLALIGSRRNNIRQKVLVKPQ